MEKRFYAAKGKIFLTMLIVLAAGVFFAWLAADMVLNEENRELFMLIIFSMFAVLLFGCALLFARMIFDNSPLVSFSTEGLEVNGPGSPGLIVWEDFEGIFPYEVHGNAFLGVIVKDEEKYIERLPARKKRLVKINQGTGFPPFNISMNSLKHRKEFIEELEKRELPFLVDEEELKKENI
jgi:hypothetical protein